MYKKIFIYLFAILIICVNAYASELSVQTALERREVYTGETFIFQLQVSGSEEPEEPDLSHLDGFRVQFAGGSQNSSSSISIINGQMTREEKKGYIFSYRLTPLKTGTIAIPSIEVKAGNMTARTEPVVIVARKPTETEDFKLRLTLSKERCYTGEPVILTVTWYIGKNVNDFNFSLPLMGDKRLTFANPEVDTQSGKKLYRIKLGDSEAIGEEGQGTLDGKRYTTISFKKVLIPVKAGTIPIEQATVTCSALTGYSRRSNDPFSSFFDDDFFGSSRRGVYSTVVVPSNTLSLRVLDLPAQGRPANFNGHTGRYHIEAAASPLNVNIGDPVTFSIKISGPPYLDHIDLPPLKDQPAFTKDFRIPDERAGAEIKGEEKIFTQTIRPLNSGVKEIPSYELPYFDTEKGEYLVTSSVPIPLTVNETKVVTLLDAEGTSETPVTGTDIETSGKGIAFSYEDMSVIEKEYLSPIACFLNGPWPYMVFTPPILYLILFSGVYISRKRNNDPLKILSRKALNVLEKKLHEAEKATPQKACVIVLDSFREYLGIKLRLPSTGSVTFADAKQHLEAMGIEQEIIEKVKDLFYSCEAGAYAGDIRFSDNFSLTKNALDAAMELEKRLK
ncbi:MAG: BatD family protein [Deltaproteobacteria bacterium]|nr:BatD family protein [Deltaproteobacteria bacterium]